MPFETKHIFSLNVDFSQRELLNAVLQNLFQAPLVPREGQVYYDSFYNVPHYWNEIEWVPWERPIHKKYVNQSAMIADQEYQLKQFIYWDGSTYWEYLGTTNGDISDYNPFGSTYVHPAYTPFNVTLTGSTVIGNIETDAIGSVVNLSVRQLQLSDLGFSGDTNADFYGNWVLNINGVETYIVGSEDIINIQEGDNVTINTSGNTITISSQDTIYTHPLYDIINLTLSGATVLSTLVTDEIGSVLSATTRTLTPQDIGAEPAFNKGDIIIPIDSGLSFTGDTENRLVGSGDLILVNNDKGSDQNIFKEIRDISGNTAISATTNNDFFQIEGENGTEVRFEYGNRIIIDSPIQDNIVRIYEIPESSIDFNLPIKQQIVNYINNLTDPIVLNQTDSKLNILIKKTKYNVICGSNSEFTGGVSYPQTDIVYLGEDSGTVTLNYDSYSIPDRFIVKYNEFIVIDTGYRGIPSYDFGGTARETFKSFLSGKTEPIFNTTYPDFLNYPDDGYPRILGLGEGSVSFNKDDINPLLTVEVYGPDDETAWEYNVTCPNGITPEPDECNIIFELINKGKGIYGLTGNTITEENLLLIEDNCNSCCDDLIQDNIVRIYGINSNEFNLDNPILPQLVNYVNNLTIPIVLTESDSKLNFVIQNDEEGSECKIIVELINKGKGIYGLGYNLISVENLLIIEDKCNLCCDNIVRVLYVPCDFVDLNLPLKPQIAAYINQMNPPLVIKENESKYNVIIDCEQANVPTSCENGIDLLFILDYTGSMGNSITNIQNEITNIINAVKNKSGDNYRLSLVIVDEGNGTYVPNYSTSDLYQQRLSENKVYINNYVDLLPNVRQYVTIITDFTDNDTEFINNLNILLEPEFPIGSGRNGPEPYDLALDICLNGTPYNGNTRTPFLLPFRTGVNKQVIILTDNLPSGNDDRYNQIYPDYPDDVDFILNNLKPSLINNNIVLSFLSPLTAVGGNNETANRVANQTIDTFTYNGVNIFTLSKKIGSRVKITKQNSGDLPDSWYVVDYENNTVTITSSFGLSTLSNGQVLLFRYFYNPIIDVALESGGLYLKNYNSTDIISSINSICGTPDEIIIFEITGVGLGSTEILACDNFNPELKLYTFCETIQIGCILYYDNIGTMPLDNNQFVLINNIIWELNSNGEIISQSVNSCDDFVTTFSFENSGRSNNTSGFACADSVKMPKTYYSECEIITTGCTIYIDSFALSPLTGSTFVVLDGQVWNINSTTGIIDSLFAETCNITTFNSFPSSGYGNDSLIACSDALSNNRTIYSNCSTISSGCDLYFDLLGEEPLTGFTRVYTDGSVWDVNSLTGEVIGFSDVQCESTTISTYNNCGYGDIVANACNDAITFNRTLYSDCGFIDIGCIIYLDDTGTTPLTGFNFVFISGMVWQISSTSGLITGISATQC